MGRGRKMGLRGIVKKTVKFEKGISRQKNRTATGSSEKLSKFKGSIQRQMAKQKAARKPGVKVNNVKKYRTDAFRRDKRIEVLRRGKSGTKYINVS